ncbi:MAG: universal stress protein [Alphaproteobacteria bacterium]
MAIQTILTLLTGTTGTRAAIRLAAQIGRAVGAQVRALHVRAEPLKSLPMMGDPMAALSVPEVMRILTETADARASQAREAFEAEIPESERATTVAACRPGTYAVLWIEARDDEGDVALRMARLSDLIVLVRPLDGVGTVSSPTFESILFESGRGVLVVPSAARQAKLGTVAVAWNGSVPAVHAVAAALPLLANADAVTVLTGTEGGYPDATAEELVEYLAAHGVTARAKNFVADPDYSGRQLLELASEAGAELLVMGAYGHSRLREFTLGGATRDVLALASLPVLMAH